MSIKKLAQHLGLSKSTVSRALNGYSDVNPDTKQRVLEAAQTLGYKANPTAKRLASGKSRNVGIILPANSRMFVSPAFSKVLAGASERLAKQDYKLMVTTIANGQDEQEVYAEFISSGLIDGVFIVRTRVDDERMTMLDKSGFPYVCLGYREGCKNDTFIDVDNKRAFYQLTKRQIEKGHTRIAFLDGPDSLTLSKYRKQGYLEAMNEAGLEVHEGWLKNGDLDEEAAEGLTKQVMSLAKRPTSILCADDTMALGTVAACEMLGFTPGVDVAIAGYGDYEHARYCKPSITSLRYDTYQVGDDMAKLMLNRLEGERYEVSNWHQAEIIARQSDDVVS